MSFGRPWPFGRSWTEWRERLWGPQRADDDLRESPPGEASVATAPPQAEERIAALRALWTDTPALSAPDGLIDYGKDYRGGASPPTPVETAYSVDRGFMTEDEARLWDALGQPPGAPSDPSRRA